MEEKTWLSKSNLTKGSNSLSIYIYITLTKYSYTINIQITTKLENVNYKKYNFHI